MTDDERRTILLIEDDPGTRTFLADNLTADGYEIAVARGLREGAQLLRSHFPDLVVLDLGLPDGSGHDLMRELKDRYGWKGIALSGYGMEDDVRRSHDAGFARHLTKPVALEALRDAIRQVAGDRMTVDD